MKKICIVFSLLFILCLIGCSPNQDKISVSNKSNIEYTQNAPDKEKELTQKDIKKGNAYALLYSEYSNFNDSINGYAIIGFYNKYDSSWKNNFGLYGGLDIFQKFFEGDGSEVIIPKTINNKKVVAIESGAFIGCYSVKSITFPDTIKDMGINQGSAFNGCNANLNLFGKDNSIVDKVSQKYKINFNSKKRTSPENIYKIFYNSDDNEGVTIEGYKFGKLESLCDTATESKSIELLSDNLKNHSDIINVPEEINGVKVTTIAPQAFLHADSFYGITFPSTVSSIETSAFQTDDEGIPITIASDSSVVENLLSKNENFKYLKRPDINSIISSNKNTK